MRPGSASNGRARFALGIFCLSLLLSMHSGAQRVRLMAANITSGNNQSYLDPGIRIFQGIQPDIVMIQEFNVGNNSTATIQDFVTTTFGSEFSYYRETVGSDQIPNGIISRYPILESGEWDDLQVSNSRDFAWARIDIPGPKDLWVVSVHMLTTSSKRPPEAAALRDLILLHVPATDYLVIGGDFNSTSRTESQFSSLDDVVVTTGPYPADRLGNVNTNASRGSPYDAILPDAELMALKVPVVIGSSTFTNGLVADTRVYLPISEISPALTTDSGESMMQHMAVIRDFMIPSAPAIASTSPLSGGTVGAAFSQNLTAAGGTSPFTWSISSGTAPAGLTLSSTGALSGTPSTSGTFNFTVLVTDSASQTASKSFSITITPTLVVSSTSPLAGGTVGTTVSRILAATGGTAPYTWTLNTGTIPNGLTFSSTGILTGTPTASGTFTFTALVTDSANQTASKSFSIIITPTLVVSSTSPFAGGTVGTAVSRTLAATGGTAPYTWSISSGTAPTGLTLSSGGTLAGTPVASGTFTFTALVTDSASATASQPFSITITPTLVVSSTSPLAGSTVGTAVSRILAATGGTAPYTWTVNTGTIPNGLTFSSTGTLTGTPTVSGTFNFTALVTDSASAAASMSFSMTITPTLGMIATSPLPAGTVGTNYVHSLTATGGTAPYQWSITAGVLPGGISLATAGGFSGSPTAAGTFPFTVQVADDAGATASMELVLTITPTLLVSGNPLLTGGTVGTALSRTVSASGGTPPYSWTLDSGSPPNGLAFPATGILSGTPTLAGTFTFSGLVSDSAGATATGEFSISITPQLTIVSGSPLNGGTVGKPLVQLLNAEGGTVPYQWSVESGDLPDGLQLTAAGEITGTPAAAGSFNFTMQVADQTGATASKPLEITITPALAVTSPATLAAGTVGSAYAQTLAASGGTPPYSWSISAGSLPAGLTLTTDGLITGAPETAGSFEFTPTVTDSAGASVGDSFTVSITPALAISTSLLAEGISGSPYSQILTSSGGTPPYNWTMTGGALPTGIDLEISGNLAGIPTLAGDYNLTARVTDATGATASRAIDLRIKEALGIISPAVLENGTVGNTYTRSLAATGGTAPYQWSLTAGQLPPGLVLDVSGILSGTPSTSGTFEFAVSVTDSVSAVAPRSFSITVREPLENFLAFHELPPDSESADPDGDGISNLMEYLLGGNPTVSDPSILPLLIYQPETQAILYQFQVTASPGSVTWKIQHGTNLTEWVEAVPGQNGVTSSTTGGAATNQVSIRIPSTGQSIYVRLVVSGP